MNMAMDLVLKILVISLPYSDIFKGVNGQTRREIGVQCWGISDCECGEQCVDLHDLKLCQNGFIRNCACLKGCGVGNIFILAGTTRWNTYCNGCRCLHAGEGILRCTRRPWCDPPDNDPEIIRNPNCELPSLYEKHEEEGAVYDRSRKSWRYPPFQAFGPIVAEKKEFQN